MAVDTNVLMRLADGHEATLDAWHLIRDRLSPVQFVVLPTVLEEVSFKALSDANDQVRKIAARVLRGLRGRWQFKPVDFDAANEAVAANAAGKLREAGLMPYEERNDAFIIAEASVQNCILLVSRDSHLLDVDRGKLSRLLSALDLPSPLIESPEKLVQKFCH